jgi:hypothetical protein
LHAELNRLSECYQAPLVLCYLEGKTQDEAALLLGVSRATVKKRLESARALLRQRLVRRGLGPAAVLAIAAWPTASVSAAVSSVLVDSTVKAATSVAAGGAAAAVFSAKVAALTQGVLRTMFLSKLKATAVGLLVAPLFVVGVLIPGLCALPQSSPGQQPAVKPQKQPPDKQPKAEPATQQDAVKVMKPGADFVRSLAYCNEGKTVALVLWKEADVRTPGSVVLWDVQKGQVVHTLQKFDKDTPGQFFNVTSSKDGTTIAVSTDKRGKIDYGAIKVWEARTAKLLSTVELSGQVRGIALSPDGKKVVGGAGVPHDGKMFVWDVKTGDIVQTLEAEGMRYFGAAISEDGKWIAGAGDENGKGKVVVWEVETGKVKHEWTDLAIMSVVAFSPDSRLVAASGPE